MKITNKFSLDSRSKSKSLISFTDGIRLGIVSIVLSLPALLQSNFILAQPSIGKLMSIEKSVRISHAKAILGSKYKRSIASQLENQGKLEESLYLQVKENLRSNGFQNQAAKLTKAILEEAKKYNMDPFLLTAVIKHESRFNPLVAGKYGEVGLMQLRPNTARWIAEKTHLDVSDFSREHLFDVAVNVKIGAAYLNYLRSEFKDNATHYLGAYNMGASNMKRQIAGKRLNTPYPDKVIKEYNRLYKITLSNTSLVTMN